MAAPSGVYKTHLALGELAARGPHGVHRLVRPNGRLRVPVRTKRGRGKNAKGKNNTGYAHIIYGLPGDQWCKYFILQSNRFLDIRRRRALNGMGSPPNKGAKNASDKAKRE
jgi:hypothetical protein